jgi:predicted DNA binding CopG/RHH family protein
MINEPDKKAFEPLDEEERELMEALERNEFVPMGNQEERKALHMQAAKNTLKKRQLSIRLPDRDVRNLKHKAEELGMGYQSLIQSVLHQYAEGTLKRAD